MQWLLGPTQFLANFGKGARIRIIAVYVSQQFGQLPESVLIEATVMLEAILGATAKLIKRPTRFGYSDNRDVQALIPDQPLNRWENLLVRKIPGGPKNTSASD